MARAIWSGVLTFGLVSVPVELYSATEAHGPVFHQFEKGTADRRREARRPARDSEAKGRPVRASQEGTIQEARREEGAG